MNSKRRHEGYLLIDHRGSPGISVDEARKAGLPVPACPAGQLYESATITCTHCNMVVILNPQRTRERGYCAKCDHYICDKVECRVACIPFKRILEVIDHETHRKGGPIIVPEQLNAVISRPDLLVSTT